MQIFTNGKRRFYPFMEFYVIYLNNQGVKNWSKYHFITTSFPGSFPYLECGAALKIGTRPWERGCEPLQQGTRN